MTANVKCVVDQRIQTCYETQIADGPVAHPEWGRRGHDTHQPPKQTSQDFYWYCIALHQFFNCWKINGMNSRTEDNVIGWRCDWLALPNKILGCLLLRAGIDSFYMQVKCANWAPYYPANTPAVHYLASKTWSSDTFTSCRRTSVLLKRS